MSRRRWLRYPPPPVVVRPSLTCVNGPRYRTRWLALAPLAAVAAGHDIATRCGVCGDWHLTDSRTTA